MEFLIVSYPGQRDVYINGQQMGETNRLIPWMLESGMHTIDLGSPQNYEPPFAGVPLKGTTAETPLNVEFAAAGFRPAPPANRPYAFVAMKYAKEYLSRFYNGIIPAAKAAGIVAVRTNHFSYTGNIVFKVTEQITNCRLLIADLSPENPNVYIELGYGWALKKPLVLLVNNSTDHPFDSSKLPFDIRQLRFDEYKETEDLKYKLQDQLIAIMNQ